MSDVSTKSAGYIDLAAEGIISEGTVTTIYSQLIQFVGQLLTGACIYLLLQWHISPKRQPRVTLAERRMVLVGLHGSLVELIDTIFSGLISRHSKLRGHAALLLLFAFVTYAWKVGELLVPSQVKFMVERFTTTVPKTGTPVSVSSSLLNRPSFPEAWSELYSMNANSALRAAMTTLQAAGVYAVVSANTTFTSPVSRTFSVNPLVLSASADINDIVNKKDGKVAFFVNNATQARLDLELANRTNLISIDVVVPSILSAYSCELLFASYEDNSRSSVDFNNTWTLVNFTDYRSTQSINLFNGLGGYGSVQYNIGDGGEVTTDFRGDQLGVLRVKAEMTPLNVVKDVEASSTYSAAFKSAFAAQAVNGTNDRFGPPIITHSLGYKCRGVIQTGRLSLSVSRTNVTLTRFDAFNTVNQTLLHQNVMGGYHAFRALHENLATVQTTCGNTGSRCNGLSGLKSIGDTLGVSVAVEGAYITSLMVPTNNANVTLARTTAAAFESVSETQDRKFVRVSIFLFVVYVAVAGLPMLGALGLSLISLAAATMSNKTAMVLNRVWGYEGWTGATEMDVDAAINDRRLGGMSRDAAARLAETHPAEAIRSDKRALIQDPAFAQMSAAPLAPAQAEFKPKTVEPTDHLPAGGDVGFAPAGPAMGYAPPQQWGAEPSYQLQQYPTAPSQQQAYPVAPPQQQPYSASPSQPLAPPPRGASSQNDHAWR
ncbi:hypothetical protein HDU96_007705 [Phlyctochytrium bullatum]|nr:hypothetical protein HDU96_007705 [Phlyctochytrium bullatum]